MEAPTGDRHSFTINAPYNVNLNLGQGKNGSISFVANEPGYLDIIVNIMNLL
jgi:hypothetical protein